MIKDGYERLKKMQNENEMIFNMAVTWLIHIGSEKASKITDEQIKKAEISMFSKDYASLLYRMTRDLAEITEEDGTAIYKFMQIEKPFNTIGFKPRKGR